MPRQKSMSKVLSSQKNAFLSPKAIKFLKKSHSKSFTLTPALKN